MTDFALLVRAAGLPEPEREARFHPTRRWRFDFLFPGKVAVEIDGGQWKAGGGRHNQDADRTKLNEAAALGYRVIHFSHTMLRDDPAACIETVRRALEGEPT